MEVDCENPLIDELINLNRYDKSFNSTCTKIGEDVRSSKLTLIDLVERLGSLLVNTAPEKREHGLLILTKVLECLPKDFLNSSQLKFISAFYADRLKDQHQVIPVTLKGILILLSFTNFPDGCLTQILQSLFQNISCQQQQQHDRLIIYSIFENALENRLQELKAMSFDFVYGVITFIDSERDPRNLMFLFSWLPKFIQSVTLGHLTEEMFDVIACYFPIDFTPPTQDVQRITREGLAEALCPCLCSIPDFAEFCIPLALEKLSSSLKIAKLDSLDLLIEGCKTFSPDSYAQNSTELWSLIQKEVLNNADEEVTNKSLHALTHIISKLSQGPDTTDAFKQTIIDIIDTVKGNLRPDTRIFLPSSRILLHVAKASETSSIYTVKEILPQLMNTYNIIMTTSVQVLLLQCITDFVKVYVEMTGSKDIEDIKELAFVPSLCLKASVSPENDLQMAGLNSIEGIAESIPTNVRGYIYENLRTLLTLNREENVRNSILRCFKTMTKLFPLEVEGKILSKISVNDLVSLDLYLDALCEVASQPQITNKILEVFTNYYINYEDLQRLSVIMKNIKRLLLTNKNNNSIYDFLLQIGNIIGFIDDVLCNNIENQDINRHESLLGNITQVLECITGIQDTSVQKEIIEKYFKPKIGTFKETKKFSLIVLFHGILCRIRQDVLEDYELIEDLCMVALNVDNNFVFQMTVELIANIINKLNAEEALILNLKIIDSLVQKGIKSNTKNAILLLSWVNKALVMRDHVYGCRYTDKLIELLNEYEEAALGFKVIMNDNCNCLSSESHCNRRLLYRQKFFTEVIERLCKDDKRQYLLAVGYLLKETPKQVVVMHFKKMLRTIILCMERLENPEVLCAILDILFNLLSDKEALFEGYIQEFVPRFLVLSKFEKSMKVRMFALRCLQAYTVDYTLHKLLPHKQFVVHQLTQCLDDPKRMVRKEAVLARNCWFLLDAPT